MNDKEPEELALTEAERTLMLTGVDETLALERQEFCGGIPVRCDFCRCRFSERTLYVDGRLRRHPAWASMCADCAQREGAGIGWGIGQLYRRRPDGKWLLVAGFQSEDHK